MHDRKQQHSQQRRDTPACRVAIVEDDPAVRTALNLFLSTHNYHCDCFGCAETFLASPILPDISCIVLDLELPGASGLDAQKILAARKIHLPIIFISGAARPEDIAEANQAGAFDFFEKPFDLGRLLSRLESALIAQHCPGIA